MTVFLLGESALAPHTRMHTILQLGSGSLPPSICSGCGCCFPTHFGEAAWTPPFCFRSAALLAFRRGCLYSSLLLVLCGTWVSAGLPPSPLFLIVAGSVSTPLRFDTYDDMFDDRMVKTHMLVFPYQSLFSSSIVCDVLGCQHSPLRSL